MNAFHHFSWPTKQTSITKTYHSEVHFIYFHLYYFQTAAFPKVSYETFCMFVSQLDPRKEMFSFCQKLSQVETYSKNKITGNLCKHIQN
jgi:hypothetical protein